jgi:hypothetical protein
VTTDLSLDEKSNKSASSSIVVVSHVKKRPSHLQLTGNNQLSQQQQQKQQQSWLVQQPPSNGPCLQTDIDADDNVSATTTTTTSTSSNNNNINCLATVDRTGSSGSPLSLPRPSPIASDFELSVLERFDQLLASLGTSSGSSLLPCTFASLPTFCLPIIFLSPATTTKQQQQPRNVRHFSAVTCFLKISLFS